MTHKKIIVELENSGEEYCSESETMVVFVVTYDKDDNETSRIQIWRQHVHEGIEPEDVYFGRDLARPSDTISLIKGLVNLAFGNQVPVEINQKEVED